MDSPEVVEPDSKNKMSELKASSSFAIDQTLNKFELRS